MTLDGPPVRELAASLLEVGGPLGGEFAVVATSRGMSPASRSGPDADLTRALVEEVLRTAFSLEGALASLIESLPEGAFEEDNATVLIDMVVGTCRPVLEAAGEPTCRATIALVAAMRDRFLDDLKAAARISQHGS